MGIKGDSIFVRDITREEVVKVAKTSKLDLQGEALDEMLESLNGIMPHINKLNKVDTSNVEPFAHTYPTILSQPQTPHTPQSHQSDKTVETVETVEMQAPRLGVDAMLRNAPKSQDGYYQVPKVVDS